MFQKRKGMSFDLLQQMSLCDLIRLITFTFMCTCDSNCFIKKKKRGTKRINIIRKFFFFFKKKNIYNQIKSITNSA
jgi:hypothetical protein